MLVPKNDSPPAWVSTVSGAEDFAYSLYLLAIGMIGFALNIGVVSVSYVKRKMLKPTEWFIPLLAVIDGSLIICTFPLTIISGFSHKWIFGNAVCKLYAFGAFFVGTFHINILAVMSAVRWAKICWPKAGPYITGRNIFAVMIVVFVYSLVWCLFPFFGWANYGYEASGLLCSLDWQDRSDSALSYISSIFITLYLVPCAVMVTCYTRIYLHLRKQSFSNSQSYIKERFLMKMMIIMCVAFILAWLPYAVVSLWAVIVPPHLLPEHFSSISLLPALLAKSATVINPCVYFYAVKKYRDYGKQILSFLRRARIEPENQESIQLHALENDLSRVRTNFLANIPRTTSHSANRSANHQVFLIEVDTDNNTGDAGQSAGATWDSSSGLIPRYPCV